MSSKMSIGGCGIISAVASTSAPISRFQSAPLISRQSLICFAASIYWRTSSNTSASINPSRKPRASERQPAPHVLERVAAEYFLLGLGEDVAERLYPGRRSYGAFVVRIIRAEKQAG